MNLSQNSMEPLVQLPPQQDPQRKTLFLDLDETLVKVLPSDVASTLHLPPKAYHAAFSFALALEGEPKQYTVFKREGLDEFLQFAAERFEIVLYTAAKQYYAESIISALGARCKFTHVLFRQHCATNAQGYHIKDLKRIQGRNIESCVLVDDNELHFQHNVGNCIPISEMDIGEPDEDEELRLLQQLLEHIDAMEDVRSFLSAQSEQ